ncbi:hypothetical protein GCM10010425_28960 [Streptomyces spororaveus]|uniref:Uncharacterized protein n=1 Tax=Streptomyces spororaveus TaxID=284039 RepID=A0ABQ3TC26_9ACTN|nr:hypothetical protein Sspor_31880 [Streptomyces spororaveus]
MPRKLAQLPGHRSPWAARGLSDEIPGRFLTALAEFFAALQEMRDASVQWLADGVRPEFGKYAHVDSGPGS